MQTGILKCLFALILFTCSISAWAQTTTVKWDAKILVGSDDESELRKPLNASKLTQKRIPKGSEVKIIKVDSVNFHQMVYVAVKKKEGWIHRYMLQDPSVLVNLIPEIRTEYKEDIRDEIVRVGMNVEEAMLAVGVPGDALPPNGSLMSVSQNSIRSAYKEDKDLKYYKSYATTTDPQYWEMGFYKNSLCYFMKGLDTKSTLEYRTKMFWNLVNVEKPSDEQNKFSDKDFASIKTDGKDCYEDENIFISWEVSASEFAFTIKNKNAFSIKIPWDEAVYVDFYGNSNRVIHNGVKYADRNAEQPPSVVPRNATLSDVLIPSDNISFSSFAKMWVTHPLMADFACPEQINDSQAIGKRVQIIFPIQIKDVVNEYTFTFELKNVQVSLK